MAWTFAILTAGACGMACLLALLPAAGHDQMWLLYAAGRMLHGARLYGPEIFETNPPLGIWLSAVPVWLGRLTPLPDTSWGKLLVVGVGVGVGVVCLRLVRAMRATWGLGAMCWLGFVYVTVFGVMPARDFGQRDHLTSLLLLPYLLAVAARAEGTVLPAWLGWGIGGMALAGVALKPHQVLVPVAVEGALLVWGQAGGWVLGRSGAGAQSKGRRVALWRPEIWAMVAAGAVFLAAVRVFAPAYLSVILPIARETYWAYGALSLKQLVEASVQLHVLAAVDVALLGWVGWRRVPAMVWVLLVASAASTVAFYLQGTGWYYQQLPALSFLALALGLLLLEAAELVRVYCPNWTPWAAAGLAVLALGLTAHFMNYPFTAARSFPIDTPDPSFFAGLSPGTAVATLTTTVDYTVPPVFKYRLTMAQRYPHLWMLPALLRSDDPVVGQRQHRIAPMRLAELERMQQRFTVEDLQRWKPRLLLVERCQDPAVRCQVLEDRHDDLLAWFARDAEFRAEFAQYHYWKSVGRFDGYVRR